MVDKKPRGKKTNSEMSSSSSSSTSSFSSDDEAEANDLKPIRGYLSNRRELSRQLFKSVKAEKIRMMLPQILKNMNLSDLEEWCASELCGMSEARILCILNGQPMLDSSDTGDSDDSGPSLEIISDTEEWLTDNDVPIKEEPSSSGLTKSKRMKAKGKTRLARKTEQEKLRPKAKTKAAMTSSAIIESDVMVKKEKENRGSTNKEGESLLDLLELEMRARAIRALIRKEEDVIPSAASEKRMALTTNALRNTLNSAVSASLTSEKNLNGKFNLGESTSSDNNDKNSGEKPSRCARLTEIGEDEDVVFVGAPPTPTIELLSSDNDDDNDEKNDNNTRNNKGHDKRDNDDETAAKSGRLLSSKNDKVPEATSNRDTTSERTVTIDKTGDGPDNLKIVITKRVSESSSSPSPTKSSKSKKITIGKQEKNNCSTSGNDQLSDKVAVEMTQSPKGLFKKIKRKQHLRSKRKTNIEDTNIVSEETDKSLNNVMPSSPVHVNEIDSEKKDDSNIVVVQAVTEIKVETREYKDALLKDTTTNIDDREVKRKVIASVKSDDDRLDDFEEIIDLDAYPEDMDEIENTDGGNSTNEVTVTKPNPQTDSQHRTLPAEPPTKDTSESAETWASRYYQTDDVQNVIKESKIQSEIRKRLRERQRLSKLNSSPKLNCPGETTPTLEKPEEKSETKPTGSVQEYLALKNANTSPVETNEVHNDILAPATVSPDSDVLPTSNLIEDETSKPNILLEDSEKNQ